MTTTETYLRYARAIIDSGVIEGLKLNYSGRPNTDPESRDTYVPWPTDSDWNDFAFRVEDWLLLQGPRLYRAGLGWQWAGSLRGKQFIGPEEPDRRLAAFIAFCLANEIEVKPVGEHESCGLRGSEVDDDT